MQTALIILASILSFFVLCTVVYLILIRPSKRHGMDAYRGTRFAHRGLHGDGAAENSLTAFQRAIDGSFGIELDVRLSADGALMVFHDDTLDRVTDESGEVSSRTAEELSKIKLLGTEDTIPTFKEVLALVDGKVPLLVEIKGGMGVGDRVAEKTAEILSTYKGDYVIESFDPFALGVIKKKMPERMRGMLSDAFLKDKKYRKPMYFVLQSLLMNVIARPDFIAYNFKNRKALPLTIMRKIFHTPAYAWTIKSAAEEAEAMKFGFDGVIFEGYLPKD